MKLDIDFSGLDVIRKHMQAELLDVTKVNILKTPLDILKSQDGAEVDINNDIFLNDDGSLIHKETGKPVLLYIREPQNHMPKFHIASCSTIRSYLQNGRIERYVAAYRDKENPSTRFKVNVLQDNGRRKSIWKELEVCKNCLTELRYKGYGDRGVNKSNIFNSFDIVEYFNMYDTTKHTINPGREENDYSYDEYPVNWDFISSRYKKEQRYICEKCGINLEFHKKYLHVHHINGYKRDCNEENLKALCIRCHSEEPQHEHLRHHRDYNSFNVIFRQRNQ